MNTLLKNKISNLYNAVSAPVSATRNALAERLQSLRETTSLLYNRMLTNVEYGRERLKYIVEKEAEEERQQQETAASKLEEVEGQQQGLATAKEQQQDDKQYDTVAKIKLV